MAGHRRLRRRRQGRQRAAPHRCRGSTAAATRASTRPLPTPSAPRMPTSMPKASSMSTTEWVHAPWACGDTTTGCREAVAQKNGLAHTTHRSIDTTSSCRGRSQRRGGLFHGGRQRHLACGFPLLAGNSATASTAAMKRHPRPGTVRTTRGATASSPSTRRTSLMHWVSAAAVATLPAHIPSWRRGENPTPAHAARSDAAREAPTARPFRDSAGARRARSQ